MACKQIFANRFPANATASLASSLAAEGPWENGAARGLWMVAGTFKNFHWTRPTAPGAGTSVTYTLVHNESDVLVLTISGTNTTISDTTTEIAIAVGDRLTWVRSYSGSPASSDDLYTGEFWGITVGESGHAGLDSLPNTTQRTSPFKFDALTTSVGAFHADIIAVAGTITGHGFRVGTAPGSGKSFTGHYYKNGVKQDGTGGTVNTAATIADTATSATWTGTLSVSPGDEVYLEYSSSGSPSTTNVGMCSKFTATTDGESHASGFELSGASTSTLYYAPMQDNSNGSATESLRRVTVGTSSFTLRDLYGRIQVAAGTPATVNLTVFKNGIATALSAPVTNVLGSDLVDEISFVSGDTWSLEYAPTGGVGTSPTPKWSAVMFALGIVEKRGSFVAGVNTTVKATRAAALGLDGNTNVHDEAGKLKVFGKLEVTETVEIGTDLDVGGSATITGALDVGGALTVVGQSTLDDVAIGGTVTGLAASLPGFGRWSPLTNGDTASPELIFVDGDTIAIWET